MKTKEAIERVRARFDKWALDEEDLTALQTLGLTNTESEDEKTRKEIIDFLIDGIWDETAINKVKQTQRYAKWVEYLNKKKEQKALEEIAKEVTKDKESAIKFLKSAGINSG